jgi:NAD-dependent SIR2 family protein deacetylase
MSLLAQLLYDNTPRPLPVASVIRLHTTANEDDYRREDNADLAAYQCGSCRRMVTKSEMYVKKDRNIGAQCKACQERQSAKKSLRRKTKP